MAEMTEEYRDLLARQIEGMGYRALATAHAFAASMPLAPSLPVKKALVEYVWEELNRFEAASDLYADVRPGDPLHDHVTERLAEIPAPESWLEMTVIQFVYDRAGRTMLAEMARSDHEPFARLAAKLLDAEHMHDILGGEGGNALRNMLVTEPEDLPRAQAYFDKWLAISLRSFGRPGSEGSKRAIELGLRRRDAADIAREYLVSLERIVEACNLRWPTREALGLELPDDTLLG